MVLKVFSTQNVITVVYTFLICFVLLKAAAASPVELGTNYSIEDVQVKYVAVGVLGVAAVITIVLVVTLCGGCTPMEVGSDGHSAAGGKNFNTYSQTQYDSVATDANTRVMNAGTTLPNDPYQHEDRSLPYSLHPQGVPTDNNFTGYNAPANQLGYTGPGSQNAPGAGAHRPAGQSEPPPPNYYEATRDPSHRAAASQSYGW